MLCRIEIEKWMQTFKISEIFGFIPDLGRLAMNYRGCLSFHCMADCAPLLIHFAGRLTPGV
jgi:hypothetical protein